MFTRLFALVGFTFTGCVFAQQPSSVVSADAALPVREVTVFKDGHAYLVRETSLKPDANGRVVLERLPTPVLGTFWPYASGGAKLVSAKSGRDQVSEELTAVDLRQIARANIGKDVVLVDHAKERIEGKLISVPSRDDTQSADNSALVLIATATGTRAVLLSQVRDLEIKGEFNPKVKVDRPRERLVLECEGGGADAKVGVMYVQKGLRWIPSYRFDLDGAGKVQVRMEASIVNDLVDLDDATVNLVIGVPKFAFEGLVDPISLQQEIAAVAERITGNARFSNMLSNSLMTQVALGPDGDYAESNAAPNAAPEVEGAASQEDLFVFTLRNITLKKGERLVMPISSFELAYRDVYTLEVPFAPPMEVRERFQDGRALELARQLAAPKAKHVVRMKNTSNAPLTTAPALVLSQGRVLAQGQLFYTPIGGETNLEINVAIDVSVETREHETGRVPNALTRFNSWYGRIDVAGEIELHNQKREAIEVEVSRRVLGLVDEVGQNGKKDQLDFAQLWNTSSQPEWWSWWHWPYWWFHFNGFGEFRWTVQLEPGASIQLDSSWHYFWG